jgi:hypothetical protein
VSWRTPPALLLLLLLLPFVQVPGGYRELCRKQ